MFCIHFFPSNVKNPLAVVGETCAKLAPFRSFLSIRTKFDLFGGIQSFVDPDIRRRSTCVCARGESSRSRETSADSG